MRRLRGVSQPVVLGLVGVLGLGMVVFFNNQSMPPTPPEMVMDPAVQTKMIDGKKAYSKDGFSSYTTDPEPWMIPASSVKTDKSAKSNEDSGDQVAGEPPQSAPQSEPVPAFQPESSAPEIPHGKWDGNNDMWSKGVTLIYNGGDTIGLSDYYTYNPKENVDGYYQFTSSNDNGHPVAVVNMRVNRREKGYYDDATYRIQFGISKVIVKISTITYSPSGKVVDRMNNWTYKLDPA